jgi:acyl-ACP thioesterase
MLINEKTRSMVFPQKEGIVIPETKTGLEPQLPSAPKSVEITAETPYTVPYSAIDINGHMNNARYLDVAENVMPEALRARDIERITCEYAAEIRPEETVSLETGADENAFYMACMRDGKRLFRLRFDYQEGKAGT